MAHLIPKAKLIPRPAEEAKELERARMNNVVAEAKAEQTATDAADCAKVVADARAKQKEFDQRELVAFLARRSATEKTCAINGRYRAVKLTADDLSKADGEGYDLHIKELILAKLQEARLLNLELVKLRQAKP